MPTHMRTIMRWVLSTSWQGQVWLKLTNVRIIVRSIWYLYLGGSSRHHIEWRQQGVDGCNGNAVANRTAIIDDVVRRITRSEHRDGPVTRTGSEASHKRKSLAVLTDLPAKSGHIIGRRYDPSHWARDLEEAVQRSGLPADFIANDRVASGKQVPLCLERIGVPHLAGPVGDSTLLIAGETWSVVACAELTLLHKVGPASLLRKAM